MQLERTLVMLKPPVISKQLTGELIALLESYGTLVALRSTQLTPETIEEFYPHIKHLPFFPEMSNLYCSEPSVLILLEGEDIISQIRQAVGTTLNPDPHSIRGIFANPDVSFDNVIHASDSAQAVKRECEILTQNGRW